MSEVIEVYYKELRLDARSIRIGCLELLFISRPCPIRFFRRGLYPPRQRRSIDFVYFGVGPFELRVWGWL